MFQKKKKKKKMEEEENKFVITNVNKKKKGFFFPNKNNVNIETPIGLINWLEHFFEVKFDYDPCPFHSENDNLTEKSEWGKCNFVNPPFSGKKGENSPYDFFIKAVEEAKKGKSSYILLPSRFGNSLFTNTIFPLCDSIVFLPRSIKFEGYELPFPIDLVVIEIKAGYHYPNVKRKCLFQYFDFPVSNKKGKVRCKSGWKLSFYEI